MHKVDNDQPDRWGAKTPSKDIESVAQRLSNFVSSARRAEAAA